MQCMYFLLMMIGGGFLIITFLVGEVFEFAHDFGDTLGGAVDGMLGNFGFHAPHLFEHADGVPSPFSSRVIFAFVTGFGGMGTILSYYDFSQVGTILLSLAAGFAGGAVVWGFTFVMFRQSATSQLRDVDFAGATGRVTMDIPGGARYGEVSVMVRESSETWFAVSEDGQPIAVSTTVTVVSRNGGRLTVKKAG
jgi:membrane protein implicated in regulation of membrane protease activity